MNENEDVIVEVDDEPTGLSVPWLIASVIASILIWGWLINVKFALILVFSLLVHEFGHYYCMGREGIKHRRMIMIPLVGALAISGEPFGTYLREAKISLAGPIGGLFALITYLILFLITNQPIWMSGVAIASLINLFNLVFAVPVLDGGRVLKSAAFSISEEAGDSFYWLGILATIVFSVQVSPIGLLILFMLFNDMSIKIRAKERIKTEESELKKIELKKVAYPEKMKQKEAFICFILFICLIILYIINLKVAANYFDVPVSNIGMLFKKLTF